MNMPMMHDAPRLASGQDNRLRILCYAAVDCSHPGGVQRVVSSLSRSLKCAGNEVKTVWSEPADEQVTGHEICQLHARTKDKAPFIPGRRSHIPSLARTAGLLARFRPQIVNFHFVTRAAHNFLVMRKLFGYRLVLSLHGSDILQPWSQDGAYLPSLLRGADAVTSVSGAVRDEAIRRGGMAAGLHQLIPNGIDTGFWSRDAGKQRRPGGLRLVTVGRLEPVKGYDVLLDAIDQLHRRGLVERLILIGSGSQDNALRHQARQLGIEDRIEFAGPLAPEAVRDHLRDADMFVLSSRSEGMPLALMEAMACGLPCVATRVGGVEEFSAGIVALVPPGQAHSLAAAIELLWANPDRVLEVGERGVRRIREYSIGKCNLTYQRLFNEIVR